MKRCGISRLHSMALLQFVFLEENEYFMPPTPFLPPTLPPTKTSYLGKGYWAWCWMNDCNMHECSNCNHISVVLYQWTLTEGICSVFESLRFSSQAAMRTCIWLQVPHSVGTSKETKLNRKQKQTNRKRYWLSLGVGILHVDNWYLKAKQAPSSSSCQGLVCVRRLQVLQRCVSMKVVTSVLWVL